MKKRKENTGDGIEQTDISKADSYRAVLKDLLRQRDETTLLISTLSKIIHEGSEPKAACYDCDAPYGEDGWCDVIVPSETWNKIAPEAALLCFRCMTKRLLLNGLEKVPVIVASGPYTDANEAWRLIGWQHGYDIGKSEGMKVATALYFPSEKYDPAPPAAPHADAPEPEPGGVD